MIKPRALKPGDTIRLISPSSPPKDRAALHVAINAFETLGYQVKFSDSIFARTGYLAGSDEVRADDFTSAFTDAHANAVLCVRGGYGASRILSLIDWGAIDTSKVFLGFSDATVLHCALWKKFEMGTFSGPVLMSDLKEDLPDARTWDHAVSILSGKRRSGPLITAPFDLAGPSVLVGGQSYGRLMGGNLSLICSLIGTPWLPDFRRSILFLEDVGEAPYRVDRLLTQLLNACVLEQVAGIVLGDFCYSEAHRRSDEQKGLQTMEEVLRDRLGHLGVPVLMNVPFGHIQPKITVPFGTLVVLDCEKRNLLLQESSVQ
ncbi:MAG: LD-carboxypeptidase [Verrucomicrobiae bacterium]|nr:LD-carboxypeptidase [Verrucomicrobiae bacterium]